MGGKTSKILSYEEAAQQLSDADRQHLAECFKLSGRTATTMDKSTFINKVVANIVPDMYLESFYTAWGGDSQEITLKDAMVGMVVVTKADPLLRKKFLFGMLDTYGDEAVPRRAFEAMLLPSEYPLPKPIVDFFKTNERMDFRHFSEFVDKNRSVMTLFEWVFAPPPPKASEVNAPTFHETIAHLTNFSNIEEVKTIERRFWDIQGYSARCDVKILAKALAPAIPPAIVARLMYLWDENKDDVLDFPELIKGLSVICRAAPQDSIAFAFHIFDIDEDGVLNAAEIDGLLSTVHPSPTPVASADAAAPARTRSFSLSLQRSTEAAERADADSQTGVEAVGADGESDAQEPEDKEDIAVPAYNAPLPLSDSKAFLDARATLEASSLTLEQFRTSVVMQAQVAVFLRRVREALVLTMGVRPSTLAEEAEAIRSLRNAERAQNIHSTPGEAGFLISMAWLNKWKLYVGYDQPGAAGALADSSSSSSSSAPSTPSKAASKQAAAASKGSSRQSFSRASSATPTPASTPATPASSSQSVSVSHPHPGPINNDPLLHVPGMVERVLSSASHRWGHSVRSGLVKERDFVHASEALWTALHLWYGGGPPLPRPTMRVTDATGAARIDVELHPFTFKVMRHQPPRAGHGPGDRDGRTKLPPVVLYFTIECSRTQTIAEMARYVCKEQAKLNKARSNLKLDEMRLWDYRRPAKPVLLEDDALTVEQARLDDGQQILLEIRNTDLSWPSELFLVAKAQEESADGDIDTGTSAKNRQLGATGLSNLGNTCFMNSSLQCLTHTPPLTEYFTQCSHHAEINVHNPLGTKGHMASHYGDLVKKLWAGKASVAPVKFRRAIQRFAPQFSGNQQHDSQELLAFLLDGLHEDLNRVTVKPYVERKDSDGRPDNVVARESWENHVQRNKSVIVDLFSGLFKSQLRCMTCQFVSVAFDAFTFLQLPLPMQSSTFIEVRLVRLDGSTPVRYGVQVPSEPANPTFATLKAALARVCGMDPAELVFLEAGSTIARITTDEYQKIRATNGMALTAYQIVPRPAAPPLPDIPGDADQSEPVPRPAGDVAVDETTAPVAAPAPATAPVPAPVPAPAGLETTTVTDGAATITTFGVDASSKKEEAPAPLNAAVPQAPSPRAHSTSSSVDESYSSSSKGPNAGRIGALPRHSMAGNGTSAPAAPKVPFVVRSVEGHVVVAHRKLVKQEHHYLVAPLRPVMFGSPLLVPYKQGETTWQELYAAIWRMVRRFVQAERRHLIDKRALPYPFELKTVIFNGMACSECRWYQNCLGCVRACSSTPVDVPATALLALDWDLTTLHLHFVNSELRNVVDHESMDEWRRAAEKPISLEDCLSAFTKEEELGKDELWYCPRCKSHQQAAKKMDIWTLPPFLIIHLKRFQSHNGAWVKSHRPVKFTLSDFDPYKYATPCVQAAVERARSGAQASGAASATAAPSGNGDEGEQQAAVQLGEDIAAAESSTDTEEPVGPPAEKKQRADAGDNSNGHAHAGENGNGASGPKDGETAAAEGEAAMKKSEDAAKALPRDEDIDIAQVDPHSSFYTNPNAPRKFDLYALSSHIGIMGGGHYVAYAQDKESRWHIFNDSACKQVSPEEVEKESSHAYMLFYQCRDLDMSKFIPSRPEGPLPPLPKIDDDYGEDGDRKRDLCTVS